MNFSENNEDKNSKYNNHGEDIYPGASINSIKH